MQEKHLGQCIHIRQAKFLPRVQVIPPPPDKQASWQVARQVPERGTAPCLTGNSWAQSVLPSPTAQRAQAAHGMKHPHYAPFLQWMAPRRKHPGGVCFHRAPLWSSVGPARPPTHTWAEREEGTVSYSETASCMAYGLLKQ